MTPEEFRQAIEAAIEKQKRLKFTIDLTPRQLKKAEQLTPFIQDDDPRSRFFRQLIIDSITDYQEEETAMNICQRCNTSNQLLEVTAKCSDSCFAKYQEQTWDGYAPNIKNVCGGDYVEFVVCLECGQLQGNWPQRSEEED